MITDKERPLNQRGRHDAPLMATVMKQQHWKIDHWLSSTALRAEQTVQLMLKDLQLNEAIVQREDALYLASPSVLLAHISAASDRINTLAVTAHNPGIGELASLLSGTATAMPTCAVIAFQLHIQQWKDILQSKPTLNPLAYETPERISSNIRI